MRLFFCCLAGGFGLAALFLAGLCWSSPLLRGAGAGPLFLLWLGSGFTFAGGQWGTAVAMAGSE